MNHERIVLSVLLAPILFMSLGSSTGAFNSRSSGLRFGVQGLRLVGCRVYWVQGAGYLGIKLRVCASVRGFRINAQ